MTVWSVVVPYALVVIPEVHPQETDSIYLPTALSPRQTRGRKKVRMPRRRRHSQRAELSNLLSKIDWTIWATLTFGYDPPSVDHCFGVYNKWWTSVEDRHQMAPFYFAILEKVPHLHFHVLIGDMLETDVTVLPQLWKGRSQFEIYDPSMGACAYIGKYMDSGQAEIDLGGRGLEKAFAGVRQVER